MKSILCLNLFSLSLQSKAQGITGNMKGDGLGTGGTLIVSQGKSTPYLDPKTPRCSEHKTNERKQTLKLNKSLKACDIIDLRLKPLSHRRNLARVPC